MIQDYLKILEDSLHKKIAVLDEITEYNKGQEELFKQKELSMEALDVNMAQKDELIQKLEELDEGFESLYEKIREQLLDNRDAYKVQIEVLQGLISQVTEKGVSVQAQEARNKKLLEDYFRNQRSQLRRGRASSKVAYGYYKNNSGEMSSQYLDQKQ